MNRQNFAKLYESEKYGQILVKLEDCDEYTGGGMLTISIHVDTEVQSELGLIELKLRAPWDDMEKTLAEMTLERAEEFAETLDQSVRELYSEGGR